MRTILPIFFALALIAPAGAQNCEWGGSPPELSTPTGHYVDNDLCQPACLASVWIYQESNGIDGLQRGDEVVDHTCGGKFPADTLLLKVQA